jgi:hypothetical protein
MAFGFEIKLARRKFGEITAMKWAYLTALGAVAC